MFWLLCRIFCIRDTESHHILIVLCSFFTAFLWRKLKIYQLKIRKTFSVLLLSLKNLNINQFIVRCVFGYKVLYHLSCFLFSVHKMLIFIIKIMNFAYYLLTGAPKPCLPCLISVVIQHLSLELPALFFIFNSVTLLIHSNMFSIFSHIQPSSPALNMRQFQKRYCNVVVLVQRRAFIIASHHFLWFTNIKILNWETKNTIIRERFMHSLILGNRFYRKISWIAWNQ